MMRCETVLRLGCALLIFAGANSVEAHGHGQGSVETLLAHELSSHEGPGDNFNNDLARNFHSPRLEYNEWLPVGRGDPLKNDPTYDYSPPVLDRVRYWSEGSKDKSAGNDILLLGVPSKKSSAGPVGKDWNSVPPVARRNYFSHQPHGVAAPNQLPTVLMPPPLGNFLGGPDSGAGFWGGSSVGASQRVDNQPGEGFKYRPTAGSFPLPGQYQGPKHPDPPISQPITAQFHHHHQPQPVQAGSVGVGFNRQQQHPYVTTIRLTTPAGDTVKRPLLKTILQNEHSYPFTKTAMTSTVTEYTSGGFYDAQNINAMAQTIFHPPQTTEYLQPQPTKVVPKLNTEIRAPFVTPAGPFVTPVSVHHSPPVTSTTTVRSTPIAPMEAQTLPQHTDLALHSSMVGSFSSQPVTTPPSAPPAMTTDTIFSHYKQPTTPERWSPYLIIEGHSKVKTYGLNTNDTLMQLPRMVPVASTKDPIVRHVVNRDPETGAEMGVTHLATTRRPPVYEIHTERTRPANANPAGDKNAPTKSDGQNEASAAESLLTLLDASPFGDMLKHDDAIGNTLDGAGGGKDSKTRRNSGPPFGPNWGKYDKGSTTANMPTMLTCFTVAFSTLPGSAITNP